METNTQKKKLILSNPRGFCAGVVRAIETVEKALEIWGAPIYVKHEIVHNRHVVDRLRDMGAIFIEDIESVPEGAKLIYSAHGVSPAIREQAKKRNLFEIDATCALVTRVHSAVKRFTSQDYHIVLIGHRKHVEVIGTAGEAPEQTTVVEKPEDVADLTFSQEDKLFYVTQTTLSLDDVRGITEALLEKYPNIQTLPTSSICYATTNRQMAIKAITGETEMILVIGDKQSSNSNRLREVAENRGIPAYLINGASEIQEKWIEGVTTIGMSAGASTPENIVQECIERLKTLGVKEVNDHIHIEEEVVFGLPKEVRNIEKKSQLAMAT